MQTVSSTYQALLAADAAKEVKVVIAGMTYEQDKLVSAKTSVALMQGPAVGNAVSQQLDLVLLNPGTIPRMAEIDLYVRLNDGTTQSEWLPKGVFFIDTREYDETADQLTIHAYDAMLKTEQSFTQAGSQGEWPRTDIAVVKEIAYRIGLSTSASATDGIDSRTLAILTNGYAVQYPGITLEDGTPQYSTDGAYSMREVLGYIGAMYGGNWCISDAGKLRLVPFAIIGPLNTDNPALGEIVYFNAYPDIKWCVDHVDGDYVYLGLYNAIELIEFDSNNSKSYSGSTIASKCITFLNNTIPNVADYLEDVTVEGVTSKVFIPTYYQFSGRTGYGDTSGPVFSYTSASAANRIACIANWSSFSYFWLSTAFDSINVWSVGDSGDIDGHNYPIIPLGFRPEVKVKFKEDIRIGQNAATLETSPAFEPLSRVTLIVGTDEDGDEVSYTAGDDTGSELTANCPWATQTIANRLLTKLGGYVYQPFTAGDALLDPAAELGDEVSVGGITSIVYTMDTTFDALYTADISAPQDEEIDHEYPYKPKENREIVRKTATITSELRVDVDTITAAVSGKIDGMTAQSMINTSISGITLSASAGANQSTITITANGITVDSAVVTFSSIVADSIVANASITSPEIYGGKFYSSVNGPYAIVSDHSGWVDFKLMNGNTVPFEFYEDVGHVTIKSYGDNFLILDNTTQGSEYLKILKPFVLTSNVNYGTLAQRPAAGMPGRIFFVRQ